MGHILNLSNNINEQLQTRLKFVVSLSCLALEPSQRFTHQIPVDRLQYLHSKNYSSLLVAYRIHYTINVIIYFNEDDT